MKKYLLIFGVLSAGLLSAQSPIFENGYLAEATSDQDFVLEIAIEDNGDHYTSDFSWGAGAGAIRKYAKDSTQLWEVGTSTSSTQRALIQSIVPNGFGELYITGSTNGAVTLTSADLSTVDIPYSGFGDWRAFVARLDASGVWQWAYNVENLYAGYGSSGSQQYLLPAVDASGNLILTGAIKTTHNFDLKGGTVNVAANINPQYFIAKYDEDANLQWIQTVEGNTGDSYPRSIVVDANDNIIVAGSFAGTADFNTSFATNAVTSQSTSYLDIFVVKYNSSGSFQWVFDLTSTTATTTGDDEVTGLSIDDDGDFYLSGEFDGTIAFNPLGGAAVQLWSNIGEGQMPFLAKYDTDGDLITAAKYDGETIYDLANQGTDLYYAFEDGSGTFLGKKSADGTIVWEEQFDGAVERIIDLHISGNYMMVQGDISTRNVNVNPFGSDYIQGGIATPVFTSLFSFPEPIIPCSARADSASLVALYNATDGANWVTPWDISMPMNTWTSGLTFNASGNVTKIKLENQNLTGDLPEELLDMCYLDTVTIAGNDLSTTIESALAAFKSDIHLLNLSGNGLTGEIPTNVIRFTEITQLFIGTNEITGEIPTQLGQLETLEYLNLAVNELTGEIPASIDDLSNLISLSLLQNNLTGSIPDEIGRLSNLNTLMLDENELSGTLTDSLGNLTNLTMLSIAFNEFSGALPQSLTNFGSSTILTVFGNAYTFGSFAGYEDIDPNFYYAPQDSISLQDLVYVSAGSNYTIDLGIDEGVFNNEYTWYKGVIEIATTSFGQLTLSNVQGADAGEYWCEVTNSDWPSLTLVSTKLDLNIGEASDYRNCWSNTMPLIYDREGGLDLVVDANGNSYVSKDDYADGEIYKYDVNGDLVWKKNMELLSDPTYYIVEPKSMELTAEGDGLVLVGRIRGQVDFDMGAGTNVVNTGDAFEFFLAEYDLDGELQWVKTFADVNDATDHVSFVEDLTVTTLGRIIVTGEAFTAGEIDPDPNGSAIRLPGSFVIMYDASGNYLTSMSSTDIKRSLQVYADNSGGFYFTGQFDNTVDFDPSGSTSSLTSTNSADGFVAHYDQGFGLSAVHHFEGDDAIDIRDIALDASGSMFVVGDFQGEYDFDANGSGFVLDGLTSGSRTAIFLVALDDALNFSYAFHLKGTNNTNSAEAVTIDDDKVLLSGKFQGIMDFDPSFITQNMTSNSYAVSTFLVEYDLFGSYKWAVQFGGTSSSNIGLDMRAKDGNLILLAEYSGETDFDPFDGETELTEVTANALFLSKFSVTDCGAWDNESPFIISAPDEQFLVEDFDELMWDMTSYFSDDAGVAGLTYSTLGNVDILLDWTDEMVAISSTSGFSGIEDLTFVATDVNGQQSAFTVRFNVSPLTGVTMDENGIKVFPTITQDWINVESLEEDVTDLHVINMSGELVESTTESRIDVSLIQSGTYILEVSTLSETYRYKFVKK